MENRAAFVEGNVGLVRSLVPRFLGRGLEYDDLFQAGCMGLIKAADHFDPARGFQFSTYAVPVILGEMRRLFRDGGAVKVSRSLKMLSIKAARIAEQMEMETGSAPTVSELAAVLEVSEERCAEALSAGMQPISLTNDENDRELNIPVCSHEESVSDRLALRQVIAALPEQDRQLLEYRYYGNKTQVETAKRLGISQVQVSRREKKLLLQLRSLLL